MYVLISIQPARRSSGTPEQRRVELRVQNEIYKERFNVCLNLYPTLPAVAQVLLSEGGLNYGCRML